MNIKTSYTKYSSLIFLFIAIIFFAGFVKALFVHEYLISISLFLVSVFLLIVIQYIYVTITFGAENLEVKRSFLFLNVWPSRKYKKAIVEYKDILAARFSSSHKGEFVIAIIDKEDNFLYRVEASSWDFSQLKEEFIKRNIEVLDFWDGK